MPGDALVIDIVNPGTPIDVDNLGEPIPIDAGGQGKLVFGVGLGLGWMGLGVDALGNADVGTAGATPLPILNAG